MFAGGIDSESVLSVEPSPRLQRSKSAAHPSRLNLNSHQPNNPFLDPSESVTRLSVREEEFGWSGSVGGIRGRDDRQIERDTEYERKMDERTRMRHERKLARAQQARGLAPTGSARPSQGAGPSGTAGASEPPPYESSTRRRPVFAPTEADLERAEGAQAGPVEQPSGGPTGMSLSRAKSLRDKVEAALGRWNSISRSKSIGRSKSVSAIDVSVPPSPPPPAPAPVERKEGLGALARRLSRKITIEDRQRRRREREAMLYAEPPLLSHDLVGAASPFPMRPALSTLVPTEQLKYGEAHTDYSPNPYRRRRNLSEVQRAPNSSNAHRHLLQHQPTSPSSSSPFSK